MMTRRHIHGRLTTIGSLAIHTGERDDITDQPLRMDARGLPVIPGTALAGALRAAARRTLGAERTDELFGGTSTDPDGRLLRHPSPTVVLDAELSDPGPRIRAERRHHVGIDRDTLTARESTLFDEMVWPHGLEFDLRLECDGDEETLRDLRLALDDLASPRGGVGAGACPVTIDGLSTGPAAADVASFILAAAARWDDPDHGAWPNTDARVAYPTPTAAAQSDMSDAIWLELALELELRDPLASRVPVDPSASTDLDNLPFTATRWHEGSLERTVGLDAASVRGRLRQRAEYWAAAAGQPAGDPWAPDVDHPLHRTFGRAPSGREDAAARAARLRVSDFLHEDGWAAANPWDLETIETVDRIAIDRLSGGTYASAKFQDTVVRDGVHLTGRLALGCPEGGAIDDLDVAFLVAGLRDLATGTVGLGGSTRSGYGTVRVVHSEWRWCSEDGQVTTADAPEGDLVPPAWANRVRAAWQQWAGGTA